MTLHSLYKTPWKIKRACRREKFYVLVHFTTHYLCFLNKGPSFSLCTGPCLDEPSLQPLVSGQFPVQLAISTFPLPCPWLSVGGDLHYGTGNIWKYNHKEQISLHIESVFFSLTFAFYCFCYKLRILSKAWDIQSSPFWRLWPLKV